MPKAPSPDARISRVAARHHGLVTRQRALACGLTDRQIAHRVRRGVWGRVGPGVYRIVAAPTSLAQDSYGAALVAGDDTVVCGLSALALLGVCQAPPVPMLCAPPTGGGTTPGALVRRSPLTRADRTAVGPIPITTPPRALLEAAPLVSDEVLDELVDTVIDRHLATPSSILGAIRRSVPGRGRAGAPRLREALRPWLEGIRPGSPAEARLLRHLADRGLPPPMRQHRVALPGGSVAVLDLAWPRAMAALEYDGARWHGPRQLAPDVAREERLRALGWWIGRADRHDLAPSSTRLLQELTPRLACLAA